MISDNVLEEASKLQAAAAELRQQAIELENKWDQERKQGAERSFAMFDGNKDGKVDLPELRVGLEAKLRRNFVKQLTGRMGRKPTREEVDEMIAELPGGSLLTDKAGLALIQAYDRNGDGFLQPDEFAPVEEIRAKLEAIFRQQEEEEREARVAAREMSNSAMQKGRTDEEEKSIVVPALVNNGPATAADRALSALPYLLPVLDVLSYAGHLFSSHPELFGWAQPFLGLLAVYQSIPFSGLAAYFMVQVAANNPSVNKLVRFNLRQAINLDIALLLPGVLGAFAAAAAGIDAYKLVPLGQAGADVVVVAVLAAVAYSVGTSSLGIFPNKLPVLGAINRENPDREEVGGDE
ncbi:unnamed protein product [Choristocarpus tenellus]